MLSFGYWMFICRSKGFQDSVLFTILHRMSLFFLPNTTLILAKGNVYNFLSLSLFGM